MILLPDVFRQSYVIRSFFAFPLIPKEGRKKAYSPCWNRIGKGTTMLFLYPLCKEIKVSSRWGMPNKNRTAPRN